MAVDSEQRTPLMRDYLAQFQKRAFKIITSFKL